jgi:hypothetical protein
VPRIVEWYEQTGGVDGVDVYGVATANDERRPNYPASDWLELERWPYPTLVDDTASSAAATFGLSGYPFFVLIDADGNVVSRAKGEMAIEELEGRLVALRNAAARGESG